MVGHAANFKALIVYQKSKILAKEEAAEYLAS